MTDKTRNPEELPEEELAEEGEQLPDREVMSIISPDPPLGRLPDDPLGGPFPS